MITKPLGALAATLLTTTLTLAAGVSGAQAAVSAATPSAVADGAATGAHATHHAAADSSSLDDYLLSVAESSAELWKASLTNAGYTWQTVQVNIVDGPSQTSSPCGTSGDPALYGTTVNPAFFCGSDNTIYLSSEWIANYVETQLGDGSDGAAFIVSHEMGHAAQHAEGNDEPQGVVVRPWELQADCLSGVWFNRAGFAQADGQAADKTAYDLGDNSTDLGHHGTPAERAAAFWTGYQSGEGQSCPLDVGAGS